MTPGTEDDDFTQALERVLSRELAGFRSLVSCQKLTAGASQETYRIVIEEAASGSDASDARSVQRQLALRRSQPHTPADSGVGVISLATEARLFQLASAAGIPGPDVHYVLRSEG